MNILPKKSWHVRNKDNVEKVRKDEENARIQEKELNRRAEAADQEAKRNFLRKKARDRMIKNSGDLTDALQCAIAKPSPSNSSPAVNLSSHAKNEEHEREKKEEQTNYEKKLGVLKYLAQGSAETMEESEKPWYFKAPKRPNPDTQDSDEEADERDMKRKSSLDPMNAMKARVKEKKDSDKRKKGKKDEHKLKKKHKYQEETERRLNTKNDKLAKLRKERLEREKREKERTRVLMNGEDKTPVDPTPQRYHSQFNPHLSRNRTRF